MVNIPVGNSRDDLCVRAVRYVLASVISRIPGHFLCLEWSPLLNAWLYSDAWAAQNGMNMNSTMQSVGRLRPYRALNKVEWQTVVAVSYVCDPNGHTVAEGLVEARNLHVPRTRGDTREELRARSNLLSRQGIVR